MSLQLNNGIRSTIVTFVLWQATEELKKNVKLKKPDFFFLQLDFLDFTFLVVDCFAVNVSDYGLNRLKFMNHLKGMGDYLRDSK